MKAREKTRVHFTTPSEKHKNEAVSALKTTHLRHNIKEIIAVTPFYFSKFRRRHKEANTWKETYQDLITDRR
jgi:hypothetical protein